MANTLPIQAKHFDYVCGMGFDVHPIKPTTEDHFLMLCGIQIPCRYEIIAHSDGDVALHAVADAMLGAIGAGDIGEHFPPTDNRWKNADSQLFIRHIQKLYAEKNAHLVNIDITLICEHPKIGPHKSAMRDNLIALLGLSSERINIKATTTEKLGFLGRSEGIAAQAIVSVKISA